MIGTLRTVSKMLISPSNLIGRSRLLSNSQFDPPYLDSLLPPIPLYDSVNVQIKGYDFVTLENYQKEISKIARILDISVSDGWATPAVINKINKFKYNSSTVEKEYMLTTYERNVQVVDLTSTFAPIFLQMIQAAQPPGTDLEVFQHLDEHDNIRYIPDMELNELKTQLTELGGPVKKRKH